jgi:uncharacterized protein YbjT (DUF2867 family)
MELFRGKHAAEQRLEASRVPWTIVHATAFIETWAEIMRHAIVFGRGESPINFVAVADVAAAVERSVIDPELRGRILEIAGPENLTLNELAARLQQAQARPRRVRHIPRPALRATAPFSRQARAAIVMDTTDMAFRTSSGHQANDRPPERGHRARTLTRD